MLQIAVFCGSSPGKSKKMTDHARLLGHTLAKRKCRLVYGGSKLGLMGELADAVLDKGGSVRGGDPLVFNEKGKGSPATHRVNSDRNYARKKIGDVSKK